MGDEIREELFKVLVVGDSNVGKTSLIKRYVHDMFTTQYKTTIGVDFALKVVNFDDNLVVRLQLWDIAGQERHGTMTRVYYREAVGAWVVFDVTRIATFESAQKWKLDIDSKVFLADGSKIPVVLLGNKSDLAQDGFKTEEEMSRYCTEKGFIGWFQTSAKENTNIDKASHFLIEHILSKGALPPVVDPDDDGKKIDIQGPKTPKKKVEKEGCC